MRVPLPPPVCKCGVSTVHFAFLIFNSGTNVWRMPVVHSFMMLHAPFPNHPASEIRSTRIYRELHDLMVHSLPDSLWVVSYNYTGNLAKFTAIQIQTRQLFKADVDGQQDDLRAAFLSSWLFCPSSHMYKESRWKRKWRGHSFRLVAHKTLSHANWYSLYI